MTLRRRNKEEAEKTKDLESVLVFGYACKIFRDDERAMLIDRGQHLIPWMGDPSVMIDRYDGRGHLYDIRAYDADVVDSHGMLSDKEKALEKACDEERYLELRSDILEKQMYEEEEMKRLYEAVGEDSAYAAVGFNYDQQQAQQEVKIEKEEDDPYEEIPELQVPKGVNLPPTIKMHAVIEKTAAFISTQGSQMEIVIAAKQKNNPQFGFLNFGHELNVYYKHIVRMVQKGKYKPKPQEAYNKRSNEGMEGHDGYLHPSLGGNQEPEPEQSPRKFLESVTAKVPTGQIANTAYAKLLDNLSKHTGRDSPQPQQKAVARHAAPVKRSDATVEKPNTIAKPPPLPECVNHENKPPEMATPDPVTVPGPNQPPPPGTEPLHPPNQPRYDPNYPHQNYDYKQYFSHYDEGPYDFNAYYGAYGNYGAYPHEGYAPTHTGTDSAENSNHGIPDSIKTNKNENTENIAAVEDETDVQLADKSAQVQEDSDEELELPDHITIPSKEVRPIIDKMAIYVVRNGGDFELMMRKKNDERFRFLNSWHPHHTYYEHKRDRLRREMNGEPEPDYSTSLDPGAAKSVSFSIKPKDSDSPAVAKKTSSLLVDTDDEEQGGDVTERDDSVADSETSANEKKQAEENLKNRLAVAAREKLTVVKEVGKLKAERKKRAAMFASLLHKNPNDSEPASLSRISSVASLTSLPGGNTSRSNSPMPSALISATSSVANTPPPTDSRLSPDRTESPVTKTLLEKIHKRSKSSSSSRSRSRSPPRRKSKRRSKSRSPSRSKPRRSKHYRHSRPKRPRSRSRKSRSNSRHRRKSPYLPSAYRRSSSPHLKRRKSRSRSPIHHKRRKTRTPSPTRHKRSKHRRSMSKSRSRRSPSRSPSRRKRRSSSKSRLKSKKSKSKKSKRSHRKSASRKKGKMVPIPELTPPPREVEKIIVSSESEQESKDTATVQNGAKENEEKSNHSSRSSSRSSSPGHTSEGEIKSPKPSEDLLVKVRAMLQAHKEILDGD